MSAKDVTAYFQNLDAHLAAVVDPKMALDDIDRERKRVERLEQAVAAWAEKGKGESPSRFSAWDLGIIDGELAMRAQRQRERTAP